MIIFFKRKNAEIKSLERSSNAKRKNSKISNAKRTQTQRSNAAFALCVHSSGRNGVFERRPRGELFGGPIKLVIFSIFPIY